MRLDITLSQRRSRARLNTLPPIHLRIISKHALFKCIHSPLTPGILLFFRYGRRKAPLGRIENVNSPRVLRARIRIRIASYSRAAAHLSPLFPCIYLTYTPLRFFFNSITLLLVGWERDNIYVFILEYMNFRCGRPLEFAYWPLDQSVSFCARWAKVSCGSCRKRGCRILSVLPQERDRGREKESYACLRSCYGCGYEAKMLFARMRAPVRSCIQVHCWFIRRYIRAFFCSGEEDRF